MLKLSDGEFGTTRVAIRTIRTLQAHFNKRSTPAFPKKRSSAGYLQRSAQQFRISMRSVVFGTCVVGSECDTAISTIGLTAITGVVQSSKPEFEPPTREPAMDTITFGDALVRSRSDNGTNDVATSDIAQIGGGHGGVNPL